MPRQARNRSFKLSIPACTLSCVALMTTAQPGHDVLLRGPRKFCLVRSVCMEESLDPAAANQTENLQLTAQRNQEGQIKRLRADAPQHIQQNVHGGCITANRVGSCGPTMHGGWHDARARRNSLPQAYVTARKFVSQPCRSDCNAGGCNQIP